MNKQTIKVFTIVGILDIVFKISGFIIGRFTEWYKLYVVLDLLSLLCFLTLIFFIGRDLRDNYMKQIWQVYLFIGYSLLHSMVTIFQHGSLVSLSIMGLLLLIFSIIVAVFFINSVYKLFGIIFLLAVFLSILVPWVLSQILPEEKMNLIGYIRLLPVIYPVVLIYMVRGELSKMYDEVNSIAPDSA